MVADLGVSHQLQAYSRGGAVQLDTAAGAGTHVQTVLTGKDALTPLAWCAPEVRIKLTRDVLRFTRFFLAANHAVVGNLTTCGPGRD